MAHNTNCPNDTQNPEKTVRLLFDRVLPTVSDAGETEISRAFEECKSSWGSCRLVTGSKAQIQAAYRSFKALFTGVNSSAHSLVPESAGLPPLFNPICHAFGDHDRRGVRIGPHHIGHDRGIDHA